jgi:hypothetical protein
MYVCMYAYIHIFQTHVSIVRSCMDVSYIHVRRFAGRISHATPHFLIFLYENMCVYIYIYVCVCVYVYIYIYIYIYIHTYTYSRPMSQVCDLVWKFHTYMFDDLLDGSATPIMSEAEAQQEIRRLLGPDSVVAFVTKVLSSLKHVLQNEVTCMYGMHVCVCVCVCVRQRGCVRV